LIVSLTVAPYAPDWFPNPFVVQVYGAFDVVWLSALTLLAIPPTNAATSAAAVTVANHRARI
jgi:hypothetical protein